MRLLNIHNFRVTRRLISSSAFVHVLKLLRAVSCFYLGERRLWRAGFVQLLSLRMSVLQRDSRRCEMADKTESIRSYIGKFVCPHVLCPLAREFV